MSSEEAGDTGSKPDDTLTNREKEILKMVALGFSNKEIAHKAAISVKSVETYKARALDKLNLYSRAQIVKFALDNGWLSSPKQ
jgi:DNA-binding NarL/FixJ family response regulator